MRICVHILPASLVLVLFGTTACAKKPDISNAAPPAASAAPAPAAAVSTIEVGKHVGTNKRVTDTTTSFAPRDTMYLSVTTDNAPANAMLTAKWMFETGQVVDSTVQTVAGPSAGGTTAVTEFHVVKPTGWPAGKYTVTVMMDGREVGTKQLEVKK